MLGWVFFSSDKFRLFNQPFLTDFFISFKRYCCPELKIKKDISPVINFRKVMGV